MCMTLDYVFHTCVMVMLDDVMMMTMARYMMLGDCGCGHWYDDHIVILIFLLMYIYGFFFMNSMGRQIFILWYLSSCVWWCILLMSMSMIHMCDAILFICLSIYVKVIYIYYNYNYKLCTITIVIEIYHLEYN